MDTNEADCNSHKRYAWTLTLGALGVVYGDIGTSPLYAMRECFQEHGHMAPNVANVLGVLSLIFWALIVIISIKYVMIMLRADNRGEGGQLALTALALQQPSTRERKKRLRLEWLGLFGAALMYGDGVITPAISVLGAVEGLKVVTPFFEPYIIGFTVGILIFLFLIQRNGTSFVGKWFGPVILVWFATLALLGIYGIVKTENWEVFAAINPLYGIEFLWTSGARGMLALGSVFLVVTGGEALYADMGHFGRKPIRIGWSYVVLPALLLNYLGQGALLISEPDTIDNPFYRLAPTWFLIPLVVLSTAATVIASQALISGAFSMTRQAVQLGYLPRLRITHTSERQIGQIYVPIINVVLLLMTLLFVVTFRSASNLAGAYGIAVSTTMVITTILTFTVAREGWGWTPLRCALVFVPLGIVDAVFFLANFAKIYDGGWVPLAMGIAVFCLMTTWKRGREILGAALQSLTPAFKQFLADIKVDNSIRVPGTAIFMTRNIERTPPALIHNVKHNRVVHKTVILLSVYTEDRPKVEDEERLTVEELGGGFYSLTLRFGFMETPDVPRALEKVKKIIPDFTVSGATFFLGRETLLPTNKPGMALWREHLFAVMSQNAQRATQFYQIPPEQVIEIGFQVTI